MFKIILFYGVNKGLPVLYCWPNTIVNSLEDKSNLLNFMAVCFISNPIPQITVEKQQKKCLILVDAFSSCEHKALVFSSEAFDQPEAAERRVWPGTLKCLKKVAVKNVAISKQIPNVLRAARAPWDASSRFQGGTWQDIPFTKWHKSKKNGQTKETA